jgi:hypothetical protein
MITSHLASLVGQSLMYRAQRHHGYMVHSQPAKKAIKTLHVACGNIVQQVSNYKNDLTHAPHVVHMMVRSACGF